MKGNSKSIGNSKPTNVIPWDSTAPPILVVTEIPAREDGVLNFWALLWPKNGLCTPFTIKAEYVFFRWEYRTFANTKERRVAWTKSIQNAVETISQGGSSTANNLASSRNIATSSKVKEEGKPRAASAGLQSSAKDFARGGSSREESHNNEEAFPRRDPEVGSVPPRAPRAILNKAPINPRSSNFTPQPQPPLNFSAHAGANSMEEEPLAPETLQTARELHRIAQQSFKAERDKLIAESQTSTAKEETLKKWQAALSQEKNVFQKGITFQASKLTERENFVQIREQHVYDREQHVKAREDAVKEKEERAEKTEQKLRDWEAILAERGQVFVEREGKYREEQARLKAEEKKLQD
ncbi:hypothetical protein IFR05_010353 [Cadophora sp. M221]|nr:hypothetical protein IFR05_010353 [Cadophora sp. M221]